MAKQYVVECNRGSGSVLGAATTLLKNQGVVLAFNTMNEALAKARELNDDNVSINLWYRAIEQRGD